MLELSCRLVVIAFDKMNRFAVQPLAIGCYVFRSPQTEIAEEIQNVICFRTCIHAVRDCIVHFMSVLERTIAVPDDVEMSEVKVGREPNVTHLSMLVSRSR
jgi:hypothetical protein